MVNLAWKDVESYLRNGNFEDAGIAIGSIINEIMEDETTDEQVIELVEGIEGEVNI